MAYGGPLLMPTPLDLARPASPPPVLSMPMPSDTLEDDNSIVVGLKVYTKQTSPSVITGKLRTPSSGGGAGAAQNDPLRY